MEETEEPLFEPDYSIIQPFLNGLKPIRRISVSEWAQAYRVLGPSVSNFSGAWKNETTPYLRAIMDSLSVFAPYKEVVFMKGAQVGATSVAENFEGYSIHITPAPILIMFPTVAVGKRNSKRRISPLIADSPVLRQLVGEAKSRDSGNTILEKEFPGGNMMICGANSPGDLRSVNIRFFIADEIDEYPADLADQGDPIEIARVRTNSYDTNKKILFISTPKTKGISNIEKLFLETDQHYCYLPCPHCAPDAPVTGNEYKDLFADTPPPGYQQLVLEQFRFTIGRPDAVYYECIHCKKEIHNYHKTFMLPRHKWIAAHPEKSSDKVIGFHLNSFYSPVGFYSWVTMAENYEKCIKDPLKMKTFTQTTLGQPHEEEGAQPPYRVIFERALESNYRANQIPDGVCFLTAGMDVQKDRIEVEVVGWGKGRRSYSICYCVFLGPPNGTAVWNQVAALLNQTWVRETDGMVFGLSMSLIDEGYSKNEVYSFCLAMGLNKILPSKGSDTQQTPISSPKAVWIKRDGKKSEALKHINISTDYFKSALYGHLILPRDDKNGPENYCHFPNDYDIEHYKRMTVEKKITTPGVRGYEKGLWTKPSGARNEQLDCRVYAMAAATLFGYERFTDEDYDRLTGTGSDTPPVETPKEETRTGKLPKLGNLPKL